MATRSLIARLVEDNRYDVIYCHYDGYPEYNGKILKTHYNGINSKHPDEIFDGDGNGNDIKNFEEDGSINHLSDGFYSKNVYREKLQDYCDASDAEYIYVFQNGVWFYSAINKGEDMHLEIL